MESEYQLRGIRVAKQSLRDINSTAYLLCKATGFKKNKPMNIAQMFEVLRAIGIEYDVVEDDEWLPITSGCYNPSNECISLPNSVYEGACNNNYDDMHIAFHEIGHALLSHRTLLHYSNIPATKEEDAEWQADKFADCIFTRIGVTRSKQLDLFAKNKA